MPALLAQDELTCFMPEAFRQSFDRNEHAAVIVDDEEEITEVDFQWEPVPLNPATKLVFDSAGVDLTHVGWCLNKVALNRIPQTYLTNLKCPFVFHGNAISIANLLRTLCLSELPLKPAISFAVH